MNIDNIAELLSSAETYRIERTTSTTDKDKFGEAVCAFANDMPDSGKPGYLLIGVRDDGSLSGLKATDDLLKRFAAIRSDGNILPIPSLSVEAFHFEGGDIIAVEVLPSNQPPVRYRGRTWIRIGPRRDIASLAEENILAERKARNFTTFDARPCFGATLNDLDLDLFMHDYLPKAVDAQTMATDGRTIEKKMESLRLYNSVYDCPTNAAMLLFGRRPTHFFPGAYIQYVAFNGLNNAAPIVNEHPFTGSLCSVLPKIDTFIETAIAKKRPVPVSALREKTIYEYPKWSIRELVMNAIMHRDYQGNAPIKFYQYADRLEVVNHGGLYGRVRPENFPNVNDYRNPIIAEAMKVLGYVNCYNRGIATLQDELKINGNGPAQFSFRFITAFEAKVMLAKDEDGTLNGTLDGTLKQDETAQKADTKGDIKEKSISDETDSSLDGTLNGTLKLIAASPGITRNGLMTILRLSPRSASRNIALLTEKGYIERRGGKKNGGYYLVSSTNKGESTND